MINVTIGPIWQLKVSVQNAHLAFCEIQTSYKSIKIWLLIILVAPGYNSRLSQNVHMVVTM